VVLPPPDVFACEPPDEDFAGAEACEPPPPEDLFFWPQAKLGTMSKIRNTMHFPAIFLPGWTNFIVISSFWNFVFSLQPARMFNTQ
jgi:hypothetical protein